jgi:hypothetical protein
LDASRSQRRLWPGCGRALPLAEQKKKLMDPAARQELLAAEARMKPRDSTFQGGGAATTDPRKPDYGNLARAHETGCCLPDGVARRQPASGPAR